MPLATTAVRSSKCFKKLVPLILTHVCLCQGKLLTYDSLSPQTALFVWTAPKVPFSLLFVKIDGSPHCKSCWHLTPASWNCVNMTSRTFVESRSITSMCTCSFSKADHVLKYTNVFECCSIGIESFISQCTGIFKILFKLLNPSCHLCNLFVSN